MMSHQIALVVEFVGLPGAGKTTVSEQVAAKLVAQGIELVTRTDVLEKWHQTSSWRKVLKLFPANLNHWQLLLNSLLLAFQVRPLSGWSFLKALKVFSNTKRNDTVAQTENKQVVLLEQGSLQEVWSVVLQGTLRNSNTLKKEILLLTHQRPIVIVCSKLDIETSMKRIKGRPKKHDCPFDSMNSNALYSSLSLYFPYLQAIVEEAQNYGIPVLEVDASASIENQADQITEWISTQARATEQMQTT